MLDDAATSRLLSAVSTSKAAFRAAGPDRPIVVAGSPVGL